MLLRILQQRDGEYRFAGFRGIVESRAGAVAFGSLKEESAFGDGGKADEAGFAGGVGADLHIELVRVEKSVGDVDPDGGGVDGRSVGISDGEAGGAGAEPGIDLGDGLGVGWGRRGLGVQRGVSEQGRGEEDQERKGVARCVSHN